MNCKCTVEMLSAYLDRELGLVERDAVRVHLADCDRCRAEERELRALKGLLLGVRAPEPALDFEHRLMSSLREEAARPSRHRFELPRWPVAQYAPWSGLAMAAALAAFALTSSGARDEASTAPITRSHTTVARNVDFDVYAQHDEAYERADDPMSGAPLLMPTSDAP